MICCCKATGLRGIFPNERVSLAKGICQAWFIFSTSSDFGYNKHSSGAMLAPPICLPVLQSKLRMQQLVREIPSIQHILLSGLCQQRRIPCHTHWRHSRITGPSIHQWGDIAYRPQYKHTCLYGPYGQLLVTLCCCTSHMNENPGVSSFMITWIKL